MTSPDKTSNNNKDQQQSKQNIQELKQKVIEALKTCYDPEIPVDIYELGLIYDIKVTEEGDVHIVMTLTTAFCPVADSLPRQVEEKVSAIEGVRSVTVEVTFDPPWTPDRMSEKAKMELGLL